MFDRVIFPSATYIVYNISLQIVERTVLIPILGIHASHTACGTLLWNPFPLLCLFAITIEAPEDTNTPLEATNIAPENL